ncbi:MAG: chromosomal replication initiator protein DnaA, partial [Proteobacteria bacterium]|nr:chromosomal replication initiator protein DnaA [Pseudomonadota bacterium]
IFSSNILPEDIPRIDTGLRSRLSMGLVTQIKAPGFDTRVRILLKKAKAAGYEMPREVLEYIAQELCRDVRQLESGLHGIAAKGQLLNRSIDLALARGVVQTISTGHRSVTLDQIKQLISKEFSVSEKDLVGPVRKQRIVKSRQLAIFLARKYTDQSIKHIAQAFGRYHATAIYSINAVERELRQKGKLFDQVNYLSKKLETSTRGN